MNYLSKYCFEWFLFCNPSGYLIMIPFSLNYCIYLNIILIISNNNQNRYINFWYTIEIHKNDFKI